MMIDDIFSKVIKNIEDTFSSETNKWELIRKDIKIKRLPKALKNLKIVQISDFHTGPFLSRERLLFFIDIVNEQKPDIAVITGDMLHESVKDLPTVIEAISRIKARYGVFSILGNHDHYDDYTEVVKAFSDAGLKLLIEETEVLTINGEKLNIIGIDYPIVGRPVEFNYYDQIARAKTGSYPDAVNILLAHNPGAFPSAAKLGIDLTLSGHTHGGQWILGEMDLFGEKVVLSPVYPIHKYVKGHYTIGDHNLYVNKGLGHWFPIRVNCPSEVTSIRLV